MKWIWFVFLCMVAVWDWKYREIPVWIYGIFGMFGLAVTVKTLIETGCNAEAVRTVAELAAGVGVGLFLLLLGRVGQGAIGAGDGWFFLVTGLYLPWQEVLCLLCYGLLFCGLFSMSLVLWGVVKGISVRNRKLPFLPFLVPVGIWVMCL